MKVKKIMELISKDVSCPGRTAVEQIYWTHDVSQSTKYREGQRDLLARTSLRSNFCGHHCN